MSLLKRATMSPCHLARAGTGAGPARPRFWPRLLATSLGALVFAGAAQATTYYVSPSGSDTNAGTSAQSAWRTVTKVNGTCLSPGDSVLFQGGQLFSDTSLNPKCSGTSSAPITIGAYGTGMPSVSQGVWMSGGQHDIVFDSLDLTSSSSNIFSSSGSGSAANNITLQNSVVHDTPYVGVYGQPQDSGWKILNTTIRHTGDSGIINQSPGMVVSGDTITDTGYAGLAYATHGIYAKAPNMTISHNDFSNNHGGQAVSIRMHGTSVYANAIHDTSYGIAFFMQDPQTTGTFYVYDNRFWNITGFVFYYSPNGTTSAINAVWDSNTALVTGGGEGINLSEMQPGAWAEVSDNVFTGSLGSGYRGCATCTERNNDWYGVSSNRPSGSGDQYVSPQLSSTPGLAPQSGSPVIDHGAMSTRVAYRLACDGSPLDYCGAMPDQGGVEFGTANGGTDITAPSAPSSLNVSPLSTSGLLSWAASTDAVGVAGYTIYLNGQKLATTTGLSYQYANLTCGQSYTVGVDAYDAAGNHSSITTAALVTTSCATPSPGGAVVGVTFTDSGGKTGLSFTATATASAPSGIASVAFAIDGTNICIDTLDPYSCAVTVSKGWHTLTVTATDNLGVAVTDSVRFQALTNR